MVEVILNLGSLEQGTLSETGTESSADDQVRSYAYVANDYSFFKGVADIRAAVLKPVEGSMEGIPKSSPSTYDAVPGVPSQYTATNGELNNPNYKIVYYWWHSGSEADHNYKRGCVTLKIPIYNYSGKPHAYGFRDISSSAYASFNIAYDSVDVIGNSITYTSDGETITKSITQLLSASSDNYYGEERGVRDSGDKPCDVAYLGYDSRNRVRYSKRWVQSREDNIIDFSEGLAIAKWKFVLKVEGVSSLSPEHILNDHKKFTLQMDSWEMLQDHSLINSGMCHEIDSALFVAPFPASFWRLNSVDIPTLNSEHWSPLLEPDDDFLFTEPYPTSFWFVDEVPEVSFFKLPESDDGPTFQYPYPASLWWYDEVVDRVRNIMIPDELFADPTGGAFYHAENLEYVKIPRSVTSIGQTAFEGTQVKEVCISRTCKYSKSSFPKDCKVIFYEDMYDENYRIVVSGKHSYRYIETVAHSEDSTTDEIP